MKTAPTLFGNNINLRLVKEGDSELLRRWRNENRVFFVNSTFITRKMQKKWLEKYLVNPNDLIFMIETKQEKPIGTVSLYKIDKKKRKAEYGRMMIGEEDFRGRGYAMDATAVILEYGFSVLKLDELRLVILKDNTRGRNFYKRFGFSYKGTEKRNGEVLKMILKKKSE